MKYDSQTLSQEDNSCAAKGCSNVGAYRLRVLYLRKNGWFCSSCANSLRADGLISKADEDAACGVYSATATIKGAKNDNPA